VPFFSEARTAIGSREGFTDAGSSTLATGCASMETGTTALATLTFFASFGFFGCLGSLEIGAWYDRRSTDKITMKIRVMKITMMMKTIMKENLHFILNTRRTNKDRETGPERARSSLAWRPVTWRQPGRVCRPFAKARHLRSHHSRRHRRRCRRRPPRRRRCRRPHCQNRHPRHYRRHCLGRCWIWPISMKRKTKRMRQMAPT
jgi:hypothetical protein